MSGHQNQSSDEKPKRVRHRPGTREIGPGVCCRCRVGPRAKSDGYCNPCRAAAQRERRAKARDALQKLAESQERIRELETAVKILRERLRLLERFAGHRGHL